MSPEYAELRLKSVGEFGAPQPISTGFASWLRYCSDVAHRRPSKLGTMFCRLPAGTLYILGLLRKNSLCVQVSVLLYLQRYCTTLEQRPSAKLCGVVQGMELRNFRRRRHLYSAGGGITLGIGPCSYGRPM